MSWKEIQYLSIYNPERLLKLMMERMTRTETCVK